MNLNCALPDLPDLGRQCQADFCQACDMFPVDMGIDVGPLQARINECKRRYHRELWRILCDGVDGKQQDGDSRDGERSFGDGGRDGAGTAKTAGGAGRQRFRYLDLNNDNDERQRNSKAVSTRNDADDILKDLDARDDIDQKRDNRHNRSRPPKKLNQSNSSESPATGSRRPNRRRRSRSVGENATKNGVGGNWSPIEAELQKLHSSLAAAAALAATATTPVDGEGKEGRRRRRMTIPESEEANESLEDTALTDGEGESQTTKTDTKARQGHTLVVTLSVDSSKHAVATSSRTASFRTDNATTSGLMRIASSIGQTAVTIPAQAAKTSAGTTATANGTPTRSVTSSSNRWDRTGSSSGGSSPRTANRRMKTTKSETINSSLMEPAGTSAGTRIGASRS